MKFVLRIATLSLLTLFSTLAAVNAQQGNIRRRPPVNAIPSGQSTVKGRVLYKDNNEALKKSRLRIFTSADSGIVVFTNDRGEFIVPNLGAATYYIAVEGPGMAMQSGFGMRIPIPMAAIPRAEDFEEIVPRHDTSFIVDGVNNVEVEVRVSRGGTVSGKVTRQNGSPVPFAPITLLSREGRTEGPYSARYSAETDKDGKFKLAHVPEGDYLISAAVENKNAGDDIRARLRGETQIVTYYPSATSARDAATVRVETGREASGVNITLVNRNSFAVSGMVMQGRGGNPLADANVILRSKDAEMNGALLPGMGQRSTRTNAEGRWSFNNVMEGEYVVTALAPRSRPSRTAGAQMPDREQMFRESRMRFLVAQQDVLVSTTNLEGIALVIYGPGSIVGTVQMEDGSPIPEGLVFFVEFVSKGSRPAPPMPVRVRLDGYFAIGDVPSGDTYVGIGLPPNSKFVVRSATLSGSDLKGAPVHIEEGIESGPIQVVLSQPGVVTGRVLSANNEPRGGMQVLLAPIDNEKQRFRTAYPTVRTDPDGNFTLSGPPGEYYLFARRRDDLPAIVSPEFVQSNLSSAQRVTLVAGETKTVEVRVN